VDEGAFLLDVREPKELEAGFIPGATAIPLDQLRDRLSEIPREEIIYVNCHAGLRGYLASRILQENGFKAVNLDGGYKTYSIAKKERALVQEELIQFID